MMKLFQLVCFISWLCFVRGDSVADTLVDNWLAHARNMMNTTKNQQVAVDGLHFKTKCGALVTWSTCNVTADVGYMYDMSSLYRYSPLVIKPDNANTANVTVNLGYRELEIFYPNMLINGPGVNMEYRGINVSLTSVLDFTINMKLDYSRGVDQCSDSFKISPPATLPKFIASVQDPKTQLPVDELQGLITSFLQQVSEHIESLIVYEKVCDKLAMLI